MIAEMLTNIIARVPGGFMFSDGMLFMAGLWFGVNKIKSLMTKKN